MEGRAPCMVIVESMDTGAVRLDAARWGNSAALAQLFGIAEPVVAVRGSEEDVITLLPPAPDGTYPDMVAGGRYLVLSSDQMRDEDEPAPPMTRARYMQWVAEQRARVAAVQEARRSVIAAHYKPLHPELWTMPASDWLHADFATAVGPDCSEAQVRAFARADTDGVYSFPFLAPAVCAKLSAEVAHFARSGIPAAQPNTMNYHGVILDYLGLTPALRALRTEILVPRITRHLYANDGGDSLDAHHAFVVDYSLDTDRELGFHHDASDVTLNVCLGDVFSGGELYFCGLLDDPSTHDQNVT